MNNVFYLDLAEIVLPDAVYEMEESKKFKIMYRRAIKYGETVGCFYSETESSYSVVLKDETGAVRAIIEFEK